MAGIVQRQKSCLANGLQICLVLGTKIPTDWPNRDKFLMSPKQLFILDNRASPTKQKPKTEYHNHYLYSDYTGSRLTFLTGGNEFREI